MAKLALQTLLLGLLFILALFTLTGAKHTHPLDLPDDDSVSFRDPSITLPEPEMKKTILLPSEKPESEPATVVELEQNESENETSVVDTAGMVEEEEEEEIEKPEMFGLRHHRCHHPHPRPHPHHQISFRQFDAGETERSYGNDMLVADPEMEKGLEQREGSLENDMLVADPEMEKNGFEGSLENDMLAADPEMEKGVGEGALEQDLTEIHVADVGGRRHAPSQWVGLHFGAWPRSRDHEHGPHHHHHNEEEEDHRHEHRPGDVDRREHHRDEEERRHHHHHEEDGPRKRPFGIGRREENGVGLVKRFRKFLHNIDF